MSCGPPYTRLPDPPGALTPVEEASRRATFKGCGYLDDDGWRINPFYLDSVKAWDRQWLRARAALTKATEDTIAETYRRLREGEALFASDCKEAAFRAARDEFGAVRRGHLVIDQRLLLEHWWVVRGDRTVDPSFLAPRGSRLDASRRLYAPLPTDAAGAFDDSPYTGCTVSWGECSESTPCEWCAARFDLIRKFPALRPGEIIIAEAKVQPSQRVIIMLPLTPMQEITEAVVDGSKAGAAYSVAKDITDLLVKHTGVSLPAFFLSGSGAHLLPVLLCYGIAFATVLIPGIPKGDAIRKIATYAAKGAAAHAVAEWMPSIRTVVPQILGLAEMHDLKVEPTDKQP